MSNTKTMKCASLDETAGLMALAYSPERAAKIAGISKGSLYQAIKRRELSARKLARRTVILHTDLLAWLSALPLK